MSDTQSLASHAKMVPMYHYVTFALIFIPTVYFGYAAVTAFSVGAVMLFALSVGVVLATFFARVFPLGVQDRVIRLEERLRLQRLLPADMESRIGEIRTDLLIGLRFAPDDEVADLARRVLAGELTDRKGVKAAIRAWRPDHQRI
jgi:hypothetical protein